jgi:CheY-like chemotaxis protein
MASYTILIAEDDEDTIRIYTEMFTEYQDIKLELVKSGNQAIELVKDTRYDAIILDLRLPGANGMQVIAAAKDKVNRTTPVYLVSGFLDDSIIKIAQNLGVADAISKPFKPRDLSQKIYERLQKGAKKPHKYDTKVINYFVAAAIEIIEYYFKIKPSIAAPRIKTPETPPRGNVTGLISINGNGFTGSMALSTDVMFVKNLSNYLFPEQNVTLTKELVTDIVGELCNQIIGRVKLSFVKAGQNAIIGLPTVITGKGHRLYHKTKNPILLLPITIDKLHADLEFCFNTDETPPQAKLEDKKQEVAEGLIFFE